MSTLDFWVFISALGGRNFLLLPFLFLVLYFLYKKEYTKTILFLVGYLGGIILNKILKEIFQTPRPDNPLIPIEGYGFPSGHAMSAVIFYSLLILLFYKKIKHKFAKITFIVVSILIILLVGLSRIILNVHSVYDILGGYVIGLLWLFLVYKITAKFDL